MVVAQVSKKLSLKYGMAILSVCFALAVVLLLLEAPTGILQGVVLDETGKPLGAAKVYLEQYPKFRRTTFTNSAGEFRFLNAPVGTYELRAKKRGFLWDHRYDQKVMEAKVTEAPSLTLQPMSPRFYVDFWDSTKLPGEKLALSLNGAKVAKVNFSAYRIEIIDYLKTKQRLSALRQPNQPLPASPYLKLVATWQYEIPEKLAPEFNFKLPLTQKSQAWAFKKGFYVIAARAQSLDGKELFIRKVFLNRTEIGGLLKSDDEKALVLSVDLEETKPLGKIPAWVFPAHGPAQALSTNAQGLLEIPRSLLQNPNISKRVSRPAILVLKRGEAIAYLSLSQSSNWSQPGEGYVVDEDAAIPNLFTMVYTDRPLYRPGQEVFLKGLSRQLKSDGNYQTISLPKAQVRIETSRGDLLTEEALALSEEGSFEGHFRLDEEADLGHYRVITELGGREYNHYFRVEEYRKPEFKIEITPTQEQFFAGDPIAFNLNAQYFFGAPVEAKIAWSIYRTPYFYMPLGEGLLPDYWGDYGNRSIGGYGEYLGGGTTQTNTKGQAQVSYNTATADSDYRYNLRVIAKDLSDRNVEAEGTALVTAGDFFFRTQRERFLAFPNQNFPVEVITRNYENQPVSVSYRLEVKRQTWNPLTTRYQYKRVAKLKGETNAKGQALSEIKVKQGGFYELVLSGKDKAGRRVAFTDYLWVSASDEDSEDFGLAGRVKIVAEKKSFQAGETGKFLLVGPQKNGQVLLTIEGQKLYEHRLVTLEGFSKEIEVSFQKSWEPNVFIMATALEKKNFFSDQAATQISPAAHFLQIQINSSQEKYQPGQNAEYQIKIKDAQGKPVATEFSLGVVDEKIYALRADRTNIKDFFWGARPNQVVTQSSLPGYYSGGITKEDRNQLRRNFKDTAFWAPRLKTNTLGEATARFRLPDNLTTWRATVITANATADVGQAIHKVKAQKPLMAQIAAPRFLRTGDRAKLKALLYNHSDQDQALRVNFDLAGGLVWDDFPGHQEQSLNVPAKSSTSIDLPVFAKAPGVAKIMLQAKSKLQKSGAPLEDGVELKIPVSPFTIAEHHYQQGKLTPQESAPDQTTISLNLPANAKHSALNLSLDTSLIGQLIGSLDYLLQYPYGCVEQTMSRLLPAMQVWQLSQELDISTPQLAKKLPIILKRGLRQIQRMQNYQGGWGWWADGETDAFMSAYAMYGLLQIQKISPSLKSALAIKINPQVMRNGQENLKRLLTAKTKPNAHYFLGEAGTQAFVKYVAALAGLKPSWPQDISQQGPMVLALASLSYLQQGQFQAATQTLQQLEALAQCTAEQCSFAKPTEKWHERRLITDAWTLKALASASQKGLATSLSMQEKLVSQLLSARQGGRWSQTLSTAVVLDALSTYAQAQPGTQAGIKAQLSLAKGFAKLSPQGPLNIESPQAHWEKTLSACELQQQTCLEKATQGKALPLNPGENNLLLSAQGDHPLYWQSDFKTLLPALEQSALNSGLSIKREYFQIKRAPKDTNAQPFVAEKLSKPQVGMSIGVRLTLTSEQDLHYVMLEDPKPAGMEVLPEIRFDEKAEYISQQNVRDEKTTFFRSYLKAGTHVFNYGLIPELAGTFHVLPTLAAEMYRPEIRGRGVSQVLQVEP